MKFGKDAMRRNLLLIITLLVGITFLPSPTARTQNPGGDKLPNPEDYSAGENCKNKRKLTPIVTTPDEPGTKYKSRCVLEFWNCQTRKTEIYRTDPHGPEARCGHYVAHKAALGEREVCCDKPEAKCAPPTPWFDRSLPCKEPKSYLLSISGGTAVLYMCGYPVFHQVIGTADLVNEAYRSAMRDDLAARGLDKVCCDKFREAVRTGKPCNPGADVDCDGQPNKSDTLNNLPAIDDNFTEASGAEIHRVLPSGMTWNAIIPPERCRDCTWELTKGELKCNPDPDGAHTYEATWRCPSTGQVIPVKKLSMPGVGCL